MATPITEAGIAAQELADKLGISGGLAGEMGRISWISVAQKCIDSGVKSGLWPEVSHGSVGLDGNRGFTTDVNAPIEIPGAMPSNPTKSRSGGGAARIKKETEAVKELTAAEKERQTILKSIESSLEDGFMSMVDGTKSVKSAFKSMAAEIIKELYRVLVVQRLVGSFDVAKGTGSGLVGFLGKAFTGQLATGGSMMAGGSYLVGEKGPELVIPRHSGTVVNANQTANASGGNGTTVVNNNISVTGSDAAMVRAEVAKMIPQITNATKAAVIDARLRGGQMKAAFS